MISEVELVRALTKEKRRIELSELGTPYIKGVITGFSMALNVVRFVSDGTKQHLTNNLRGLASIRANFSPKKYRGTHAT